MADAAQPDERDLRAEHLKAGRDGRRRRSRKGRPTRAEVSRAVANWTPREPDAETSETRPRVRGRRVQGGRLVAPKGWQWVFLEAFAKLGNVRAACEAAEVSRATAYRHKARVAAFGRLWALAEEDAADRLEQEAIRRAVVGVDRPVFGNKRDAEGKNLGTQEIGTVKEYDSRLLELLLKAHKREKYAPPQRLDLRDVTEPVDVEIQQLANDLYELAKLGRGNGGALPEGRKVIEAEVVEPEGGAEGV